MGQLAPLYILLVMGIICIATCIVGLIYAFIVRYVNPKDKDKEVNTNDKIH